MMELPFEFDSEELIAACIRALEPIAVYEAPSARGAAAGTEESRRRGFPVTELLDAAAEPAGRIGRTPEEDVYDWALLPATAAAAADAETLSRAFERDARRYEAT